MRPTELSHLAAFSPLQHDPDDVLPTAEVDGIPGFVGRPVAEAAWSVSLGVGELHQYAGISGGHKGVAVGCGGRATIAALHHRDRVLDPRICVGKVEGNPFRAAIDGLGRAARCRLALLYLPATGEWLAGDPAQVVAAAAARMEPFWPCEGSFAGAVLRVPAAKGQSFYQASRAATYLALSPRPPLAPGATLVIEAPCPEGLGSEAGFVAALASGPPPWSHLLLGPPPEGAGAQRAVMLALVARRYRIVVAGCAEPAALAAVGIAASADPPPSGPDWLEVPAPFTRLPTIP